MNRRYLTHQEVIETLHADRGVEYLIGFEPRNGYFLFRYAKAIGSELRLFTHLLDFMPDHSDVYGFPYEDPDNPWISMRFPSAEALLAYTDSQPWSGAGWVNAGMIQDEWRDHPKPPLGIGS